MKFENNISPDFLYKEEGLLMPELKKMNGSANLMKKMFDKDRRERPIVRKKDGRVIELV